MTVTTDTSENSVPATTPGGIRVAVAYHSGFGHTARQAAAVAAGAASVPGTSVDLLAVDELTDELWVALDAADAIVFGTPTYMGGPSAVFRAFAEATAAAWGDGMRWKGKVGAGFTNSQNLNGDKLNTLVDLAVLGAQHGLIWVGLDLFPGWNTSTAGPDDLNRLGSWIGAMAQSHGDQGPEISPPDADLRTAEHLGARVARTAAELARGRALAA